MKGQSGLRTDLRRFLAGVLCAGGGIAGLWLGMLAAPTEPASPGVAAGLAEVMVPVMWRVGAGVVVGALVAAAVCALVPSLRPRSSVFSASELEHGSGRRRGRPLPRSSTDQVEAVGPST